MDVRISPIVELREARAEIAHLRNRNLILAQAVHELEERLVVKPPESATITAEPIPEQD